MVGIYCDFLNLMVLDVKSRELELERGEDNIWILISDSLDELNIKDKKFVDAIAHLMNDVNFPSKSPTELSTLKRQHLTTNG